MSESSAKPMLEPTASTTMHIKTKGAIFVLLHLRAYLKIMSRSYFCFLQLDSIVLQK